MSKGLTSELSQLQKHVEQVAKDFGLDGFEMIYEVLDYDEINMVAAYSGFPVRYPHWRFGMEYDRLKKGYEYGLNKIYEMVINNDPCYAYLLESNSFVDQKIVMCHVAGHNDFFKNNFAFSHTNRRMINEMANHASRVRHYMDLYGVSEVEAFIDRLLSLENLIDINAPYIVREQQLEPDDNIELKIMRIPNTHEYMEHYVNPTQFIDDQRKRLKKQQEQRLLAFPARPERDVLGFLLKHAPLKTWQADILDIVRQEAYYFVPQAMTKIMNEGWASYWHTKMMTEKVMEPKELIDFADRHSSVMVVDQHRLNPYKLGLELFRHIEERWNKGQFGREWDTCENMSQKRAWDQGLKAGQDKIFSVRKIYSDLMFIDEFLTLEFCERHGLFTYAFDKRKQQFVIESRDFLVIKNKLLSSLTNLGNPLIQVINGNFENRSELLLEHIFDGVPLDLAFAKATLKNLADIWTRPAHLVTTMEDRSVLLSHDGVNYKENILTAQV